MNDLADLDDGDGVIDAPEWLDAVDVNLKAIGVKRSRRAWIRQVLGMAEVDVLPVPDVMWHGRKVAIQWEAGRRDCVFVFGKLTFGVWVGDTDREPPDLPDGMGSTVKAALQWVYPGLYGEGVADVA